MTKVAILGFGTVGSGVYEVIETNRHGIEKRAGRPVEVKYILDIRDFPGHPASSLLTKNFDDILNDSEISVAAEVIGGATIAYEFTKKLLEAGKSVVTSNKELVATHGAELLEIAEKNGVSYLFEASVGGGIPIIHPIHQCLTANEISEIFGILNGTTNYILTQMINCGKSFEAALKSAQELGYAEANPKADVDGIDACRKIAILADLAFGKELDPDRIYTEGIRNIELTDVEYAEKSGCVIKLIGYCKRCGEKIFARVSPMLVPKSSALSVVDDVFNAILVRGNAIGDAMFYGKGAGKLPTASAVVSDIIDAAIGNSRPIKWVKSSGDIMENIENTKSVWFVRADIKEKSAVKELFGDVSFTEIKGSEFAFITPLLTEKELAEKTGMLKGCIKYIRVLY